MSILAPFELYRPLDLFFIQLTHEKRYGSRATNAAARARLTVVCLIFSGTMDIRDFWYPKYSIRDMVAVLVCGEGGVST